MGCTVREKHIRTNRRTRSVKQDQDHAPLDRAAITKSMLESGTKPLNYNPESSQINSNFTETPNTHPNLNPNPNPSGTYNPQSSNFDDCGWGYCTEEQLEDILLKNLEFMYSEALAKLVALGYDEELSLKAILRNGHCYGGMDVLTNIIHNSMAYLNGACCGTNNGSYCEDSELVFTDLRQLEEYSLAGMVCLLQQVRPHLSKGDAMWCLLMSDLNVGRASTIEIPMLPSLTSGGAVNDAEGVTSGSTCAGNTGAVGPTPGLCKFHGGWGFGYGGSSETNAKGFNGLFSYASEAAQNGEIDFSKRFNLSPSMKSLLKRNVAAFAAGYRANSKQFPAPPQAATSALPSNGDNAKGGVSVAGTTQTEEGEEQNDSKNQDVLSSVLSKFRDLNLDENLEQVPEEHKDEILVSLTLQIQDLERQVKERKEWAHQKAMQAARKLSSDLAELKILRMEREETQRLKKGKQTLEDTTMKRLSDMENALRKASGQVDGANSAVRQLEIENAEIRAEMEASKLSASESVTTCLEIAKREKKCLKRLLNWEKQKAKLQDEIAIEKRKITDLQQQLAQVHAAQKEAEVKWRQELKAKEEATTLVEEERRAKEATEASNKRKLETLRLKMEIDFQRHRDDLQRLELELSRLKSTAQLTCTDSNKGSGGLPSGNSQAAPRLSQGGESIARLLRELDEQDNRYSDKDGSGDRECLICMKDEVSVVFLPCAHQVMCASCGEDYGKKGKATCPCCRVPIEQKIRVFGASS